MMTKLFICLPVRRNLFFQTLAHFRSNFSILAESNVTNSHAPSENLFLHFLTTRFNMSSADTAKMLKSKPSLGRLKTLDNVEQVVYMLNRHGCTEDQIAYIIRCQPALLTISAERVLEPKIQLLKDSGIGREIVSRCPRLLTSKLEMLRSNLELLKTVFPTQDLLIRAIRTNNHILVKSLQKSFKLSVAFWGDFGFRGTELTMFLLVNPGVLTLSFLTPEQRDLIRKICIHKESNVYKYIVSIVATRRIEELEGRIHNLQLFGLSPEEALQVIRSDSTVLKLSEENVKKKMEFMLNHMGLSVDFVAKHARMLTMSLDKVMRPRFLVLQNITSMNGGGEVDPRRLLSMLMMSEDKFVSQIIEGHHESIALQTVYKNAIANVSKERVVKPMRFELKTPFGDDTDPGLSESNLEVECSLLHLFP